MPELTSEEARWLSGLAQFDAGNRLALMAIFAGFGVPASYLDVGCGTGAMVKLAKHLGVNAMGVDILPHDEPFLRQHDLREPLALGRKFDLITCIEVPEHVAPEASDNLCDILASHLAGDGINSSGLLVFTSAPPGQNGDGHVNCQPKSFWREKLESRKLKFSLSATTRLVMLWEQTHWATHWCEQNLQVFTR